MTTVDPGKDTRLVDIKGRNIVIRQLVDAQMVLMAREAKLLQKDGIDNERKMSAIARMFDMLESAVVQQEDRDYLLDLVVAGQLELNDLMSFLTVFTEEEAEKPKVRRGRPPTKRA